VGQLIRYDFFGSGVEAFTTTKDAALPYPVVTGHQVHEALVAVVDRPDYTREELRGYDAYITNLRGCAIAVRTADCIPILMYDPVSRAAAAVHAGWKGTVKRIVQKAVDAMAENYGVSLGHSGIESGSAAMASEGSSGEDYLTDGSGYGCSREGPAETGGSSRSLGGNFKPENLRAVIGPGIAADSFQVGAEVVEMFAAAGFPMDRIYSHRDESLPGMAGGHHIDLFEANRWLLIESGVPENNILVTGIDTYTEPSLFSARREGPSTGRIISAIKIL